jgi:hypothetical protein
MRRPKKIIEDIVLSALHELADASYQERVWIEGSTTEVSSLNEAVAALFDDSGLDVALEKNAVTFSAEIDACLRELRSALQTCLRRQTRQATRDLIQSLEWSLIRKKAAWLLAEIKKVEGGQNAFRRAESE